MKTYMLLRWSLKKEWRLWLEGGVALGRIGEVSSVQKAGDLSEGH